MLLEELPLLDHLTAEAETYYNEGNWTKLSWVEKALKASKSGATFESFSLTAGSYWNATSFNGGAVSVKYASGSPVEKRYFALWLCLNPATQSGYRCKFLNVGTQCEATIYKVVAGSETELTSSALFEGFIGAHFAFWNNGGSLQAWHQSEGGSWTELAAHADSTYTSGNIAIDGSGINPHFTEFSAVATATTGVGLLRMVV